MAEHPSEWTWSGTGGGTFPENGPISISTSGTYGPSETRYFGGGSYTWTPPKGFEEISSVEFFGVVSSASASPTPIEGIEVGEEIIDPPTFTAVVEVEACHSGYEDREFRETYGPSRWEKTGKPLPRSPITIFSPGKEHFHCNENAIQLTAYTSASVGMDQSVTESASLSVAAVALRQKLTGFALESWEAELIGEENPGKPHEPHCLADKPVNCATGNETESQTDLSVGGRGLGLSFTRSYNSLGGAQFDNGPLGYGWTGSYSAHLGTVESRCDGIECVPTLAVYQDNGSAVRFEERHEHWQPVEQLVQATLVHEGTNLIYTLPNQTKLTFNATTGLLSSETDRNGNTTTMTRNAEGRLESVSDPAGRKLKFAYNKEKQIESVTDPMGHAVKYTYEKNRLATVIEPGETKARWSFKYNSYNDLTTQTDGREHATTITYNEANQVTSEKDPLGRKHEWKYGIAAYGTDTTITEPNGSTTFGEFNRQGLLIKTVRKAAFSEPVTTYEYEEPSQNLIAVTDPNKHTTTYTYNAAGDRTSETDPMKDKTEWTYDSTHDVLTTKTPDGETTTIKRNAHGNAESIERPAPGKTTQLTTFKYDTHGDLESMTDPLKRIWSYEYDTNGDRNSETDPEGDKRTWGYNEDSHETSTVSPRGNVKGAEASKYTTKLELDARNRPIKVTDPLGHASKYAYDGNGNLESLIDGNANKTKYTYDADNEPTAVEEPNKAITETGYDAAGRVTSETDGNKHTTKYIRNELEEVVEIVDPRERKTTKEYEPNGLLKVLSNPYEETTKYTYDAANRTKEVSYSGGKTATVKYEYNGDSKVTHMTDGTGETIDTYDELDRLTESQNGHKEKVGYEYDVANELTKLTYPNGKAITRAYDKDGRLEKVTDWLSNATKFAYSPDSEQTATTFPTATGDEDKYAYNEADQMSEVKIAKGAETLASLVYTRDGNGQVKAITSKGLPGEEKPAYEYDANSRLKKAGTTSYEYDAANNPTKIGTGTYGYDSASELEKGANGPYAYSPLGQRAAFYESIDPTSYGYDEASNLTSVERSKEGEKPAINDAYAYDGTGMRASQTIGTTTSYLVWNTTEGVPSLLADGTNSYIYGPGGLPFEQINSTTGAGLYLHHDQQGSTRLLTGSTGKTEATFTYDVYGNTTGTTGTAKTPLGYGSQYTSTDTGLIYLRARTYDPATAQFLSVDPLQALTGEPYTYAGDNPINFADPLGLSFWSTLGQVAGVGVVCVLTDGAGCIAAGLADLDGNIVANDIHAAAEPCSASSEETKTFVELAGFGAGLGVGQLATLSPEIEQALEGVSGGKLASAQLKALGTVAGSLIGLLNGKEHEPPK